MNMNLSSIMSIFSCLYIHLAPKLSNFSSSVQLNILTHVFLITQTREIWDLFKSVEQACNLIWDYYDKIGGRYTYEITGYGYTEVEPTGLDYTAALANDLCVNNYIYYYSWVFVNILLTFLRTISLFYMVRGQLYLKKREIEKMKRKQRKKEKIRNQRRSQKKELGKLLMEKRKELYRKQQEHLMALVERNRKKIEGF